jgi:hypothetical protein
MIASWEAVRSLANGEHMHLDEIVEAPPPPGSSAWLPIIDGLKRSLVNWGGNWTVTIPIGVVSDVPTGPMSVQTALGIVHQGDVVEPPAVYRVSASLAPNRWEGEYHCWKRVLEPGVTEIVSLSRSSREIATGEGLVAEVVFEIRSGDELGHSPGG